MLIELLHKTHSDRRKRNPNYSLRAFARSLKIDSSTLSALIRRKRPLTQKTAQRLIKNLGFENSEMIRAILPEGSLEKEKIETTPILFFKEKSSDINLLKRPSFVSLRLVGNEKVGTKKNKVRSGVPSRSNPESLEKSLQELTS